MYRIEGLIGLPDKIHRKAFWSWCALTCCLLGIYAPRAFALTAADNWSALHLADSQIYASHTQWKCVLTQQPRPHLDVEKLLARTEAEWREEGENGEELNQHLANDRQLLTQEVHGWNQLSLLKFLHQGDKTRCAITSGNRAPIGTLMETLLTITGTIDFYDGRDSTVVETEENVVDGKAKTHFSGRIKRDGSEIMPHVGAANVSMLTGASLFQDYRAEDSSMRGGANNTIVIERQTFIKVKQASFPLLTRWFISKQTWRPVTMETQWNVPATKDFPANTTMRQRIHFLDYQRYPGGIWWPSHILDERLGLHPETKPPISYDYKLVKAEFNEYVDPALLERPLPAGTSITDYRFSPRPKVSYVIKKNIPSDEEVLKVVKQREAEDKVGQTPKQSAFPLIPLGLSFLILGGVFWKRSRPMAS